MWFSFPDFLSPGQISVLCLLACVFLTGKAIWRNYFSKLPPGPWGIPVIGEFAFFSNILILYAFSLFLPRRCSSQKTQHTLN